MREMVYQATNKQEVLYSGEYKGYKFAIMNLGTHPTAYVENKRGFCEYDEANEATDYIPHGGFTYLGKAHWDESDKTIYLGWDYAHLGDYVSYDFGIAELNQIIESGIGDLDEKRWTTTEIYEEVKVVIDKLLEVEE